MELTHLLEFWLVHGKPHREAKKKELADIVGD
jgi:hypothetical protein